jgi:hypothetical protein
MATAAAELVGDPSQLLHLRGREQSAGDLAAHHLDAGLALSVNAVFEAEGAELIFGNLAIEVGAGSGTKGFDLVADYAIMFNFKLLPAGKGFGHS